MQATSTADGEPQAGTTKKAPSTSVSVELAARRTGMAFQRTRMSADRTLMSIIRTSLSLIGFGFTIFQFFEKLHEANVIKKADAARHFGTALLVLGCLLLVGGIGYHAAFMLGLRRVRKDMKNEGLIYAETAYPASLTLIVAVLLLALGLVAFWSALFHTGPFG